MRKLWMHGLLPLFLLPTIAISQTKPGAPPATNQELPPLQLVEVVPMPGVAGRIDHMTADIKRHRLFVSALGNNSVEVVDYSIGKWIYSISGLNQPKGIVYVPDFGELFVVNLGDGTLKIYDDSYSEIKTLGIGVHVDYVHYDPSSKKVLVALSESKTTGGLAIIDPATNERIGTVKTDGPPEDFAIESSGQHIFASIYDTSMVESVDRKTGQLTKWQFNNAYKPVPLALNEPDHRLFVMSRIPPVMLVIDTETGKEVQRIPVGGISADLFFDPSNKRIFNVNGAGFISVFQQKDPNHYELVENVPTTVGARSGWFHEVFHRLFIAIPAKADGPAQIWEFQTP
jgi:DNA-binding beta-propeller fold protein YncE